MTLSPPGGDPFDLVLLDPPYGQGLAGKALETLSNAGRLAPGAVIVIEADRAQPEPIPASFAVADSRDYGRTRITLVRADDAIC
jgi:16S rRNA (guanine966-N2)-methyltransferase